MPDAPRPPQIRPPPNANTGKSMENTTVDIVIAVIIFFLAVGLLGSFFASTAGGYINFISWFYGRNWRLWYIVSAIIIGILNIALLAAMVWIIKRYNNLRREVAREEMASSMISPEQDIQGDWQDIQALMASSNPSDWNMAILRADAELDDFLRRLGYEGETIADRIKIVDPTKLKSVDRIWSAHRLRNTIAHDPLQQYTREMLVHAIQSYEIVFKELGALHEESV